MATKRIRKVYLVETEFAYEIWEADNYSRVQTRMERWTWSTRLVATLEEMIRRASRRSLRPEKWGAPKGPYPVVGIFPSKRQAIQRRRELAPFKEVHTQ